MLNVFGRMFGSAEILTCFVFVFTAIVAILEYFEYKSKKNKNIKKSIIPTIRLFSLFVLAVITAIITIINLKEQKETDNKVVLLIQTNSKISKEIEKLKTVLSFVKVKIAQVDSLAKIKNKNSTVNTFYNVLLNNIEHSLTIIQQLSSGNNNNLQLLNSISNHTQIKIELDTTIIQKPVIPEIKYLETIKELQDIKKSLEQIHKEIQDIKNTKVQEIDVG